MCIRDSIYITHKMDEVFKISDYVTIFRDGKLIPVSYAHLDVYKRQPLPRTVTFSSIGHEDVAVRSAKA